MAGWWIVAFLMGTIVLFGKQISDWIVGLAFKVEEFHARLKAFNNASEEQQERMGPLLKPISAPIRLYVRLRYGKEALGDFDQFLNGKPWSLVGSSTEK